MRKSFIDPTARLTLKMKQPCFIAVFSTFIYISTFTAYASDLVLNDGFEMQNTTHWIETGSIPYWDRGVVKFDVTGNGQQSWAYYQHPGDNYDGGLEQVIYMQAGETYTVSADICYHSG